LRDLADPSSGTASVEPTPWPAASGATTDTVSARADIRGVVVGGGRSVPSLVILVIITHWRGEGTTCGGGRTRGRGS